MKVVYLSNGQACHLKEKIGNKYVVNKIFEYEDEEYGWQEIEDSNDILVDMVFKNKPIQKIASEIKELQLKKQDVLKSINDLENKKRTLNYEIAQITRTQLANGKFIINRTELLTANTLALFIKDRIMPITLNSKDTSFRGIKLVLNIELSTGGERKWGTQLYDWDGYHSSDYLCEKYGVLVNPTEEEIDETIRKRLMEFEFSDYWLSSVDDKYLTPELIIRKNTIHETNQRMEIEKLETSLLETQEKLKKLYI